MKLSCLPRSFFAELSRGEISLDDWFQFAAEIGLDGVECSPVLIEPLGPATYGQFRGLAEARGLAVSNFTAYSDFTQPDRVAREREVEAMIENVRIARELGSPTVRALAGQQWPGVGRAEGVAWVVDALRRVADAADRCGVRVVLENHGKAFTWAHFDFAMQSEIFVEILDRLGDTSIGVQFDTANPLVAGEDPLALFERVQDVVAAVHLSDVPRPGVFEFVPIGAGIAPNRDVLDRLHQRGYVGWIGIEEASNLGRDAYRQAVGFVRAVWSRA